MKDRLTKRERSELMAKVRGYGNKSTELALARLLRVNKISGWRKQIEVRIKKTEGRSFKVRPDFIFPKLRLAIFVDGCFWHGCPKHGTQPKGNRAFWKNKFARNQARDRRVNRALRSTGWKVIRIWECALRRSPAHCLARVQRVLAAAN